MRNVILKIYRFSVKSLYRVLIKLAYFFPKDSQKIIFIVNVTPNAMFTNDNIYLMSKYMEENTVDYKIIRMKLNEFYSAKNLFHIYTAKALVVETVLNGLYLPSGLKVIILAYFIPFKSDDVLGVLIRENFAKIFNSKSMFYICNSSYERNYVSKSFNIPKDKFIIMGSPRREWLIKNKRGANVQDFFHINCKPAKVILYAPTYRDKFVCPEVECYQKLEKLTQILGYPNIENDLETILVKNNAIIIIALHTYLDEDVENRLQYKRLKNTYFLTKQMSLEKRVSIYDFFWSSDCLISDYSSISFDYLLTNKPIIYNFYDIEEYKKYRGISHEPIDEIAGGKQVKTKAEFLTAIKNVIDGKDLYSYKRKEVLAFIDEIEDRTKIMYNIMSYLKKGC